MFQVQALTSAGEGKYSDTVSTNTSKIFPTPRLILAAKDYVKIADCDSKKVETLTSASRPIDIAWSNEDKMVYWLNDMREIHRIQLDGHNKSKVRIIDIYYLERTSSFMIRVS